MDIRKGQVFLGIVIFLCVGLSLLMLFPDISNSGPYLNSAHGNSSYGVDRSSLSTFGYSKANCAHCHEQHANIGGAEPDPTGGPDIYALFYTNHVDQTDNFCFKCHTDISSYQTRGFIINRSYSYRAGGYADTLNDILEAFSFPPPATSHNLDDILTFITGKWGYTSESNPCATCHNPHSAIGDPANSPNSRKTAGTRGYSPVSRPSLHSNDNDVWGLWGDVDAERMNIYASSVGGRYQSPFAATGYEPDGSLTPPTPDGSNLTDFDTLCIDCHDNINNIYSSLLGRDIRNFNWSIEKHGGGSATNDSFTDVILPYQEVLLGNYVLACTDCHEPHGSPNNYLVRKQVNNGIVTVIQNGTGKGPQGYNNKEWLYLCERCHDGLRNDTPDVHVHPIDVIGDSNPDCLTCHQPVGTYKNCIDCHFHGNNQIYGTPYKNNEQLF